MASRALIRLGTQLWFPAAVVLGWAALSALSANPFLPTPAEVAIRLAQVLSISWIQSTVLPTLTTIVVGYSIGVTSALVAGIIIGGTPTLNALLTPLVVLIRSTPSAAKVPVVMAVVGIGRDAILAAVVIAVSFQMMLVVIRAIETTRREYLDVARLERFSWRETLAVVRIPAATGELLTGFYLSFQIALLVTVVSEILGSSDGLGLFILTAMGTFRIVDVWVGVIVLGSIGFAAHEAFGFIERRSVRWYHQWKGRQTPWLQ